MKKLLIPLLFMLYAITAKAELKATDALDWLALTDKQAYAASWERAAPYFQSKITKADWVTMASKARKPLGKLVLRKFVNSEAFTKLPDAPDGSYQVITFNTEFEEKVNSVETVTLVYVNAGWKVVGYYIR